MKFIRVISGKSLKRVSNAVKISESRLHRIENGESDLKKGDLDKLKAYYKLGQFKKFNESIYSNIDFIIGLILKADTNYINDVAEIDVNLSDINDQTLPYEYYLKFLQKFYLHERDDDFLNLGIVLEKVILYFEIELQVLFYAIYSCSFIYLRDFKNAEKSILKAQSIACENELLNGIIYQYLMSINNHTSKYYDNFELYSKAKKIFEKHGYKNRLINIKLLVAIAYSRSGFSRKTIEINKEILQMKNDISDNLYYTSLYNIGMEYKQLSEYSNALDYLESTLEFFNDQEVCFEIAWCYYMLEDFNNAKKYAILSKTMKETGKHFGEFCSFIEEMINKKYSNECLKMLKHIERKYADTMGIDSKRFLYQQLMSCLEKRKKPEEALMYAKKLI